jgi:hypothetical protein
VINTYYTRINCVKEDLDIWDIHFEELQPSVMSERKNSGDGTCFFNKVAQPCVE